MTFEELTDSEQWAFANAMELWSRTFRETFKWRESRLKESITATPPMSPNTLEEIRLRVESTFSERRLPLPTPESIRAELQAGLDI